MAKLNQIIAVEKGIKSRVYGALSDLNKAVQKIDLFNGFAKSYQKKDDDSEELPPENKRVQYTTDEVLNNAHRLVGELIDVTARKDYTNCVAKGTVTIAGNDIIKDAPVSFLLFLEKQLTDMRAFINNLPVLDSAEDWAKDPNSGLYKTGAIQTFRTKKVVKPIVLYNATPEHPAQTQLISEDVLVGYWNQVKQSGAMPAPDKGVLLGRIEQFLQAVKQAREAANGVDEVPVSSVGDAVFNFLLGG